MPAVAPPSKVLVTGANGFIAAHVVVALVERGFHVVGTVRTKAKGEYLKNLVGSELDYVVVPDVQDPTAHDEAVKDVDAILHIASPVVKFDGDADQVIQPAVASTVNILQSVKKHGSRVKRIIFTSSTGAIPPDTLDETKWNQEAVDTLRKLGANAPGMVKYNASKVFAERAAWDFMESNNGTLSFDLVTIAPGWVWGPMIHEGDTPDSINFSTNYILYSLNEKTAKTGDNLVIPESDGFYVDARDVAAIHVDLLASPNAGGERFIAVGGQWTWPEVYDALNADPAFPSIPLGEPDRDLPNPPTRLSTKIADTLGKRLDEVYRPFKQTVRDAVASAKERGWVWTGHEMGHA